MDDAIGGCLGYIIAGILIIALIYLIVVYVIIPVLIAIASIGGICGGVVSIWNYGNSFKDNVIRKK